MIDKRLCALLAGLLLATTAAADLPHCKSVKRPDNTACCPAPPPSCCCPPGSANAGTPPADHSEQLSQISALAINAAKDSVEVVKWIYTVSAAVLTLIVGGAAFLGYRSLRDAIKPVKKELDGHLGSVKQKTTEFEKTLEALQQSIHVEIAELHNAIGVGQILMVDTFEVTRKLRIAESIYKGDAETSKQFFEEMIEPLARIAQASEKLQNLRLLAWAQSMRAYARSKLGDFRAAIAAEHEALQTVRLMQAKGVDLPTERQAEKYFNLACFHARLKEKTEALAALQSAAAIIPTFVAEVSEEEREEFAWMADEPAFREMLNARNASPAVGDQLHSRDS